MDQIGQQHTIEEPEFDIQHLHRPPYLSAEPEPAQRPAAHLEQPDYAAPLPVPRLSPEGTPFSGWGSPTPDPDRGHTFAPLSARYQELNMHHGVLQPPAMPFPSPRPPTPRFPLFPAPVRIEGALSASPAPTGAGNSAAGSPRPANPSPSPTPSRSSTVAPLPRRSTTATPAPRASPAADNAPARSHFTPDDELALVQLCVQWQTEYTNVHGALGPFWAKIGALLKQERGVFIRDAGKKMRDLVAVRRAVVAAEIKESGTAKSDTDMKQALDQWIVRVDFIEQEKEDKGKPASALEKERAEAELHRANLFRTASRKRVLEDLSESEEEEPDPDFLEPPPDATPEELEEIALEKKRQAEELAVRRELTKRKRRAQNDSANSAANKRTEGVVAAVQAMGNRLGSAIETLANAGGQPAAADLDGRLRTLETAVATSTRQQKEREERDAQREAERKQKDRSRDESMTAMGQGIQEILRRMRGE